MLELLHNNCDILFTSLQVIVDEQLQSYEICYI